MARFVKQISPVALRKKTLTGFVYSTLSLLLLGLLVFYPYKEEDMHRIFYLVFIVNFAWSAVSYFRKSKIRDFFIEINEDLIGWRLNDNLKAVQINWDEIRWIKKERDETIILFRQSSFSDGFSIKTYPEETKREILGLIEEYAAQKNIRLANFSEPVLATA